MPTIILALFVLCLLLVVGGACLFPSKQVPGFTVLAVGLALYLVLVIARGATGH